MKTGYICLYDRILRNRRKIFKDIEYFVRYEGRHWDHKGDYYRIETIEGYFVAFVTDSEFKNLFFDEKTLNEVDALYEFFFNIRN